MKKLGMVSLGCPKNAVDTELVLGDLLGDGYEITSSQEEANVIIVNTCGFIEASKKESIDAILEMAALKTEGRCEKLVVTGCLSERYSDELLKEIPEIDHMLGVNQYPQLKQILKDTDAREKNGSANHVHDSAEYFESYMNRVLTTPFYSAYLKIGEGCSNKCSFCIIPKIRGRFRSRSPESIIAEAEHFAQRGVKEFNLISQDTTMYGVDLKMKDGLVQLLKSLSRIDGLEWLRLFYCYPTFINSELIEYIASEEKVCKYVDVPLQHTHDFMLKRMKRQETEKEVRKMIDELRTKVPGIALRTTFITGFPGETDEHFKHLIEFVREIEFDHMGVFAYSHEEGTTAYDYEDLVPGEIAVARREELMSLQQEICRNKNGARVGEVLPVLIEGSDPGEEYLVTGRLATQAPEIDGQVIIEESDVESGQIVPMLITGATDYDLVARRAEETVEKVST
ncbi:MAG TPA: 30S ribosomal protein S12 methylthiotransferase RimO [Nitrospinaceae bacterium]|jgi:ribosomal protein S12 methylthiotransferase|nr:30S ribosomal protein S12 methylthiotransferase RimO [Nitrospinota bacterium]MDP6335218.1 30S ribosomal protein S12 methylthiotransferase RimO [Nitrospinaceae bacterium]MDP7147523.1 30S ribosomal protein S12 methylthiotransferase RimO [Nitrospinaceae bacterium]MDP7611834.1 30S ribosomal protein S12 methylthiotransferase RimO [Nitrospinaceae bacterium]HJO57414.1 30S ribosomal protein S12 methylthiotransferase RimO [Nitrospinaceae bacterium]|tara:strand:- start:1203 stop:2564 length:1362 start_codon:yes stop_codon:yes gene_type:complete